MQILFLKKILKEYRSYSRAEKIFIICMMLCSFAITAEAAITRSVSASVFLGVYGPKILPYAWLVSLPLNFAVVLLYNRYIPRLGPKKMMGLVVGSAIIFIFYCAFNLKGGKTLPFILYLWKDIFIIFMFHKLWSVINSTVQLSKAKYIYGFFYGLGGLGSVLGSMVPSFFATTFGTEKLLLAALPFYFITYFAYAMAIRSRKNIKDSQDISMNMKTGNMGHGLTLIKNSKLLRFILLIVLGIQVSSTILDYQFSIYLKETFPVLDLRTEFMGRLFGFVNTINVFLQFFGSIFLLKVIGIRATHLMIPLLLMSNAFMFLIYPRFNIICAGFGTIKSLDYSIFGIAKEMLYIPLSVEEKFQAKAIIDVFAYRSSKTIVSLLILTLTYFYGENIIQLLSISVILVFAIWIYSVLSMKEYFSTIENKKPAFNK